VSGIGVELGSGFIGVEPSWFELGVLPKNRWGCGRVVWGDTP